MKINIVEDSNRIILILVYAPDDQKLLNDLRKFITKHPSVQEPKK